jgi:hypothetical protein
MDDGSDDEPQEFKMPEDDSIKGVVVDMASLSASVKNLAPSKEKTSAIKNKRGVEMHNPMFDSSDSSSEEEEEEEDGEEAGRELSNATAALKSLSPVDAKARDPAAEIFTAIDTSANGIMSFDEFAQWHKAHGFNSFCSLVKARAVFWQTMETYGTDGVDGLNLGAFREFFEAVKRDNHAKGRPNDVALAGEDDGVI